MVAVPPRMHRLKAQLLKLRHGPGAALLPSNVTRIHLEFAKKWNDGHFGPRKFWQQCLPRLKYWNPAVPMIVNRVPTTIAAATMTVYIRDEAAPQDSRGFKAITPDVQPSSSFVGASPAPAPLPSERAVRLEIKGLHSDDILRDLLAATGAVAVAPSPADLADIRDVEEQARRAAADRAVTLAYTTAKRREATLLAQARSEVEDLKKSL